MKLFLDRVPATRRDARAFTLLELVVAIGVIALLTGAIAPSVSTMVNSKARRATLQEMEELGLATTAFFADTATLPTSAIDLLQSSVPGFLGPYLYGSADDGITGGSGYAVDGWSRAYTFAVVGDQLTLTSNGRDGTAGNADDLELVIDVTPVRREWTVERLRIVNTAIQQWNAVYLATNPLPANWPAAFNTLTANGFLPLDPTLGIDGFGNDFVSDPPGLAPLARVTSSAF